MVGTQRKMWAVGGGGDENFENGKNSALKAL